MDAYLAATVLASMERPDVSPHVLGRLHIVILVLAGWLIIDAAWQWMRRR